MIKTNNITGTNILLSTTSAFWFWQGNLQAGHGGGCIDVATKTSALLNTWVHIALTYNATNRTMKLYVNGSLVSQNTNANQYTAADIQVGAYNGGTVFNGSIDVVRIWNYERSATEINDNKNGELNGNETGLVAYYKFN